MGCKSPKIRIENIDKWETASDGHKYHPAIITVPDKENERLEKLGWHARYKKQIIPCRRCIGCRLDYSRQWANRGYLESKKTNHNYFITLTYNDENLPENNTLVKDHLGKFLKDIRNDFQNHHNHTGIKYLACGEYGTQNGRPHYHAILFNCPFPTDTFYEAKIIDNEYFYRNKMVEERWKYGYSYVSTSNWHTIAYVARYVTKKIYGTHAEEYYTSKRIIPEFIRCSKGIGKEYWDENKEKIIKYDEIIIKNKKLSTSIKPPEYYMRMLKKENEQAYEQIKNKRRKENNNLQKLLDQQTSVGRLERLEIEEKTKLRQSTLLKRI